MRALVTLFLALTALACGNDPCADNDGAYCDGSPSFRNGVCFADSCVACKTFLCEGVAGCSNNPVFEANGNPVGICPNGCFVACTL